MEQTWHTSANEEEMTQNSTFPTVRLVVGPSFELNFGHWCGTVLELRLNNAPFVKVFIHDSVIFKNLLQFFSL